MMFLQRMVKQLLCIVALLLLVACGSNSAESKETMASILASGAEVISDTEVVTKASNIESELGNQFNDALLAELQAKMNRPKLAAKRYLSLAMRMDDPKIAKRATVVAATLGQVDIGLQTAKRWVSLKPENIEAQQFLALLLLRNNKFKASANQLHHIRLLLEKNHQSDSIGFYSRGLKFIGSMLSIESQHKKSYKVFSLYLDQYGSSPRQAQENLILAALAMKANQYEVVVSALAKIKDKNSVAYTSTILMEVKALRKLNRIPDAINKLTEFVKIKSVRDSTKLELVRLLILDKQRVKAESYLIRLVDKYPDNKDLLKSLIALEIDQKKWLKAKNNIAVLMQSQDYRSDANYFSGEVMEAEGNMHTALENYLKVNEGALLKRAKKKIAFIKKRLKTRKVSYKKRENK